MATKFTASQSVEIAVQKHPIPIQHYLRQPQRLVHTLVDTTRVKQLSEEVFRLKMRPLAFMSLSIQPTVDIRVWADAQGVIYLRSVGCEIIGFDYANERFDLNLKGYLSPSANETGTYLQGKADLEVKIDLPMPFSLTPKPILETTGNGLLKSVLLTIKQRLQHHLVTDYHQWISSQMDTLEATGTEMTLFNFE